MTRPLEGEHRKVFEKAFAEYDRTSDILDHISNLDPNDPDISSKREDLLNNLDNLYSALIDETEEFIEFTLDLPGLVDDILSEYVKASRDEFDKGFLDRSSEYLKQAEYYVDQLKNSDVKIDEANLAEIETLKNAISNYKSSKQLPFGSDQDNEAWDDLGLDDSELEGLDSDELKSMATRLERHFNKHPSILDGESDDLISQELRDIVTGVENGWEGFSDGELREAISFMRHLLREAELLELANGPAFELDDDFVE